MFTVPHKVGG